jgi:hypothetical protein
MERSRKEEAANLLALEQYCSGLGAESATAGLCARYNF